MQLGMVGLGRMGGNIVQRLMRHGHSCVVYDKSADAVAALAGKGATGSKNLGDLAAKLTPPRTVWLMLPAGRITDDAVNELGDALASGDAVIDGGNSFYKDDVRRARALNGKGIRYLDLGTSGGNTERTAGRDGPDSRPERGYMHCGPSGAGHFVKMIHNGIEYGLMQAYAEGFAILNAANAEARPADERYELDVADIAEVWRRGSVISSWLLDLTSLALAGDAKLENFSGVVADSGEGRWTVNTAVEQAVPATVLSAALYARFASRDEQNFAERLLSAMRKGFGGHIEPKGR